MQQLLLNKYGSKAENYAEQMMGRCMEKYDVKNASVWFWIRSAIEDLINIKRQGKPH